jgi:hypothetical protein
MSIRGYRQVATPPLLKAHFGKEYDIMHIVCKQLYLNPSLIELKIDYSA